MFMTFSLRQAPRLQQRRCLHQSRLEVTAKLAPAHLNGGAVMLQADDLPDELLVSHTDQLVHGGAPHGISNHHGATDAPDIPAPSVHPL